MRSFKKILAVFLSITTIVCSSCVEKKDNRDISTSAQKPSTLVYAIGDLSSDFAKLDIGTYNLKTFCTVLFRGLVSEDKNGCISYVLAKKCDVSSDGLVYTFTLNDDIKWSNGEDITAQDFCDFFQGLITLNYNSTYRDELKCIYGVADYIKGTKNYNNVAISAPQKNVLKIRLNYPCNYFLQMLSQPIYSLRKIDQKIYEWKNYYKDIVYSGPYIISKITKDNRITLEKNEYYFLKENIKSNKLVFDASKKSTEFLLSAFETLNNIDIFLNPPATEIERLIKNNEAVSAATFSVKAVFFNFRSSTAVSDVNFRKAVSLALYKNYINDKSICYYGKESRAYFPTGSNFNLGADEEENLQGSVYEYLKNSKYSAGDVIKIAYVEGENNKKLCESISKIINEKLKQNSGDSNVKNINFELDGYSNDEIKNVLNSSSYDIYVGEYNVRYNNPMAFFKLWCSKAPDDFCGYSNINYDSLIYSFNVSKDKSKQEEIYSKCIEELNKDVPVVPLYTKSNIICYKTYVNGINTDKYGNVLFDNLCVK